MSPRELNFETIPGMFYQKCREIPRRKILYEKKRGRWTGLRMDQVKGAVENFAYGLASLGVDRGDKVAILSHNNPKWAISDYAIACLGAVSVTVYPTLIEPQVRYILDHSDSRYVIVENEEQTRKVRGLVGEIETLKGVITMDGGTGIVKGAKGDGGKGEKRGKKVGEGGGDKGEKKRETGRNGMKRKKVLSFGSVLKRGRSHSSRTDLNVEERAMEVEPDDLLTLVYTSGTTGEPKGVMLSHRNMVSNIVAGRKIINLSPSDKFLSFLPLSHCFERMVGHYSAFSAGCSIYYAEDIKKIPDNLREVKPTIMASVPRLFEKMHTKVLDKVENDSRFKQRMFRWAMGVGREAVGNIQRGKKVKGLLSLKYRIANKLVFSKLNAKVGGNLRFFVSGGAPLCEDVGKFFGSANLLILEGYGLTETSPVITVNPPERVKFGTVGAPIPGVDVKIEDDGEILCRGDNVMVGYYKDPEATEEVMDDAGWFRTGDIGEIDDDGYLRITDRKKNLIVTSCGKNVAPVPLERALSTSELIELCMVLGNNRKFISALIVPAFPALEKWCDGEGVPSDDRERMLEAPEVKELFDRTVGKIMAPFSKYERVKKFALLSEEWTAENKLLTPTLKVKRRKVRERHGDQIEAVYGEGG